MSRNMWWQTHRLLARGARGSDVAELQRALNRELGPPTLRVDGLFGEATENRVKDFQRIHRLVEDGKVGPITHSVLFRGHFEFSIQKPPVVRQPSFTCWAAALESVLRSTWRGRPLLTVADLLGRYRGFLQPRGDITIPGFEQVARDLHFGGKVLRAEDLRVEKILSLIGKFRVHLLLVHDLTGSIGHTVVIYGVKVESGNLKLLIMDPNDFLSGGYSTLDVGVIQSLGNRVLLLAPASTGSGRF